MRCEEWEKKYTWIYYNLVLGKFFFFFEILRTVDSIIYLEKNLCTFAGDHWDFCF